MITYNYYVVLCFIALFYQIVCDYIYVFDVSLLCFIKLFVIIYMFLMVHCFVLSN